MPEETWAQRFERLMAEVMQPHPGWKLPEPPPASKPAPVPPEPPRTYGKPIVWDGPAWLYADLVERRLNLADLERVTTALALEAYGHAEERRLDELARCMRSAGLAPDETIEAYLARSGYLPAVWEAYQSERERIKGATDAALERLVAAEDAQRAERRAAIRQWIEAHMARVEALEQRAQPAQLSLF